MNWLNLSPASLMSEYRQNEQLRIELHKFVNDFIDNKNNICAEMSSRFDERQVRMILSTIGRLLLVEDGLDFGEVRDAIDIMTYYPEYAGGMVASWSFAAKEPIDKWAYSFRGQLFGKQRQVIYDVYHTALANTSTPQIAEVGCHLGRGSTREALRVLMNSPSGGKMHCIDIWPVDPHFGEMKTGFLANVDLYGGSGLVRVIHAPSDVGLNELPDKSMDVIFIDGGHEYATVKSDIEIALKKIKPDGVIFGHDCEGRPDDFKPLEAYKNQDVVHDAWISDPGQYGPRPVHAGVVLAVDEVFQREAIIQDDIWIFGTRE